MRAQGIDKAGALFHEYTRPVVIARIGAAADTNESAGTVQPGITGIGLHKVGIVLGCHLAAAAPALIACTDNFCIPLFIAVCLPSQRGHPTYIILSPEN